VTKIDFSGAPSVKIAMPLRSPAYKESINSIQTDADYQYACNDAKARTKMSLSIPIYSKGEIEYYSASSPVSNMECSKSILKKSRGFSWSEGTIEYVITSMNLDENLNHNLYRLVLPIKVLGGMRSIYHEQSLYREYCQILHQNLGQTSTVLTHCVEPVITSACCGNVDVTGELQALIYAYDTPTVLNVANTAKSIAGVKTKNHAYLQSQKRLLKDRYTIGFCEHPSWKYSPVMAYQSQCYVVQQQLKP